MHAEHTERPSLLDRGLRAFSDVRAGEGLTALLLTVTLFSVLVAYYVLKTVREPLVLATGGAELKSYAAAAQAAVLVVYVPLYSEIARRLDRMRLIYGVTLFFVGCIALFRALGAAGVPNLGFAFFVWVGVFSVSIIALFWSYANDLYGREEGERLFPIIGVGATSGSVAGAWLADWLVSEEGLRLAPLDALWVPAGLLVLSLGAYTWVNRREGPAPVAAESEQSALARAAGGFALVFRSRYLLGIGTLLILLNVVNTTGEYILGASVLERWAEVRGDYASPEAERAAKDAFIGGFYADFFFWVNLGGWLVQAFVVSRLVRYLGIAGAVFALPVVAFGAYGLVALGVAFPVLRWAKSAENLTDYSVMNTAKGMLWLPTTRDEKYSAKQAIDTFFVRLGDVLSAGLVFVGTTALGFGVQQFAVANLVLIGLWVGVAWWVVGRYHLLSEAT